MDLQPVVFLSFANDSERPLGQLKEEGELIYRRLLAGANSQYYLLHREPFASVDHIYDYLTQFKDRVIIFHYGGHAGGRHLLLEDGSAKAAGLASLLGGQKNLQLVFLNGCSTREQVDLLLESGVRAVLATSAPIDDRRAAEFAERFYQALEEDHALGEAFKMASAYLETKYETGVLIHRSAGPRRENKAESVWGLFVREDGALKWRLPRTSFQKFILRGASNRYSRSKTPVNDVLVEVLADAFRKYLDLTGMTAGNAGRRGGRRSRKNDPRVLRRAIMDCLPTPLGEQIRKLFAVDLGNEQQELADISVSRLQQLVLAYQTLAEMLFFILLSELWTIKMKQPDLPISKTCLQELKRFITMSDGDRQVYNLHGLMLKIHFVFQRNKQKDDSYPYIVEELEMLDTIFQEDQDWLKSIGFMEEMKQELYAPGNTVAADELESFCVQAEDMLAQYFAKCRFIAGYRLTSVKDIYVDNPRHKIQSFYHNQVDLDKVTAGLEDYEDAFPVFSNNSSIILYHKEEEDVDRYLNLSPFIIDENAWKKEKGSKLFFFSRFKIATDQVSYKFLSNQAEELDVSRRIYAEIKEQFDAFIELIFDRQFDVYE